MKLSKGHRIRLGSVRFVLCSIFTLLELLSWQVLEASNNGQELSEVIITIAGHEHCYQPRPDLGYVIMAQDDADAIASTHRDLSLFTQKETKYIGGRDRQGLRIIERRQSAAQNEAAIKTLSAQRQVQYAAPLFSCNGSKIAVIPEIVVRVTSDMRVDQLQSLCRKVGCTIIHPMEFTTQEYLLGVQGPNADAVFKTVNELNKINWIEWAAPNIAFNPKPRGQVMPNDEYLPMQWHLHNAGEFIGTPNVDINAPEAWEITTGDPNIVVAVIDSGVDSSHPDLVNNLVPGYDFHDNDDLPDPVGNGDMAAHGTACAGLVAADGNNHIGVVGVTWKCKVMPIRTYIWGPWGATPQSQVATAIRWAAAHGADVLSNSWGDNFPLPIVHAAFVDVTKPGGIGRGGKGCVVFFTSGNDSGPLLWPDRYPEGIAVGGTNPDDIRWDYSGYGPELDIMAPTGAWPDPTPMWTTDIVGSRGWNKDNFHDKSILDYTDTMGGTSGAGPVVAGVAALILSIEPELTNDEVRHFLCRSAKDLGDPGRDDYYGWGRVDARAALDMVLAKRADLSNNWKIDFEDLLILIELWGTTESSADIAPATRCDGIVDELDLELMMQYWGTEIPEMGSIAHWKLDETEGGIAYESVQRKDGNLQGEPLWQPTGGQVDGALELDGIDDFISTDSVLNPADGPFSVLAWVKGGAPGQVILSQEGSVNWLMVDLVDGALRTDLRNPATTGRGATPPGPPLISQTVITDGYWHRVGFVWDGSNRILYVDDIEVARDTAINLESASGGLYIGAGSAPNPGIFWSGLIDDVRIYNRAVKP